LQRDPIGDVMTLVQAKKYAGHRKARLEAVAALHGNSLVEGAQKSIFVTTSAYEPVAQRFAARTSGSMKLASSEDVAKWCEAASAGIIADVSHIIDDVSRYPDHRIVHAHTGVTMIIKSLHL
jgi:restriction endonuclease Mrr